MIHGLNPTCPAKDLLHVFHQGVLCCVIAGLICSHIESQDPSITLNQLDTFLSKNIYKHYKTWCHAKGKFASACSHRFNAIRFGKEQWSQYCELGSVYKAAVVKTMLFWCNDFLKEHVGRVHGSEARSRCIHSFAKFQFLLDSHGPFFTGEQTLQVVKYARAGLLFYQDLVAEDRARVDGRRFYKMIPKFHSLFEMAIYIEQTNRNVRFLGPDLEPRFGQPSIQSTSTISMSGCCFIWKKQITHTTPSST